MSANQSITISVKWGYELHDCQISEFTFKKILRGRKVKRVEHYYYEGKRYRAEYLFNYKHFSSLKVICDGDGELFNGSLNDVFILINGEEKNWGECLSHYEEKIYSGSEIISHEQLIKIINHRGTFGNGFYNDNKVFLHFIIEETALTETQVKSPNSLSEDDYSNLIGSAMYVFEQNADIYCVYPAVYENLPDFLTIKGFKGMWGVFHDGGHSMYFNLLKNAIRYADDHYDLYDDDFFVKED